MQSLSGDHMSTFLEDVRNRQGTMDRFLSAKNWIYTLERGGKDCLIWLKVASFLVLVCSKTSLLYVVGMEILPLKASTCSENCSSLLTSDSQRLTAAFPGPDMTN